MLIEVWLGGVRRDEVGLDEVRRDEVMKGW